MNFYTKSLNGNWWKMRMKVIGQSVVGCVFVEIDRFQDESLENVRGWFCKGFIFTSLQVKGTFLRIKENL